MPHSYGLRARTRQKFRKPFRKHGLPSTSKYVQVYRKGDYVDIAVDPAIHRGMPYQYYHGRTGVVFDVTRRSLGVEVAKVVGNRQVLKRLHVRIEHVKKSRCRVDFDARIQENRRKVQEAQKAGLPLPSLKREPKGPEAGAFVEALTIHPLAPVPYLESY